MFHSSTASPAPHTLRFLTDLSIFVAAAVTVLGWSVATLLDFAPTPYLPIWFAGVLCIYTLNRIDDDPADLINRPQHATIPPRLRLAQLTLLNLSAGFLICWPLIQRDWILLGGVLAAGGASFCYIRPIPGWGRRLKDLPVAKTFVPVIVVTGCLIIYPLLREHLTFQPLHLIATIWLISLLLFNVAACDQRDLPGDLANGVTTLPAWLGFRGTRRLLIALIVANGGSALALATLFAPHHRLQWTVLAITLPAYLIGVIWRAKKVKSPYAFEWLVEGMLLVPAAVLLALG